MRTPPALTSVRRVLAAAGPVVVATYVLAAPAAAYDDVHAAGGSPSGLTSGRIGPTLVAVLALVGVVLGVLALTAQGGPVGRARGRGARTGRRGARGGVRGHRRRRPGHGERARWSRRGRGARGARGRPRWARPGTVPAYACRSVAWRRDAAVRHRRRPVVGDLPAASAHSAAARARARATSSTSAPRRPTVTRTWARCVGPAGPTRWRRCSRSTRLVPPSAENGAPGATRMPAASRRTRAVRSSWTGSQTLMPSPGSMAMPWRGQRVAQGSAAGVVDAAGVGDGLDGAAVGEEVDEDVLEQAAGPAGAEHAAGDQPVEHGGGSADGGDAQVGAVGLGVGADVHDAVGQEGPEADVAGGRDLARVVVLDDEGVVPAQDGGELAGAGGGHAHAGRVVGARLQDDDARPGVERRSRARRAACRAGRASRGRVRARAGPAGRTAAGSRGPRRRRATRSRRRVRGCG